MICKILKSMRQRRVTGRLLIRRDAARRRRHGVLQLTHRKDASPIPKFCFRVGFVFVVGNFARTGTVEDEFSLGPSDVLTASKM